MALPNRMIFWKKSKRPSFFGHPASFSENNVAIFFGKRPKKALKVQNLRHKFLELKWLPLTLWKFSENSFVLVAWPVPKQLLIIPRYEKAMVPLAYFQLSSHLLSQTFALLLHRGKPINMRLTQHAREHILYKICLIFPNFENEAIQNRMFPPIHHTCTLRAF